LELLNALGRTVSVSGGLDRAIDRAEEIGAECVQIFGSSPRGWAFKPIPDYSCSRLIASSRGLAVRDKYTCVVLRLE